MTNVTYIYSRLLLGFLVASTSFCSALIHAASQSRTTLLAYSRPPLIESGLLRLGGPTNFPTLGLPVLLPNHGVLVVLQVSVQRLE